MIRFIRLNISQISFILTWDDSSSSNLPTSKVSSMTCQKTRQARTAASSAASSSEDLQTRSLPSARDGSVLGSKFRRSKNSLEFQGSLPWFQKKKQQQLNSEYLLNMNVLHEVFYFYLRDLYKRSLFGKFEWLTLWRNSFWFKLPFRNRVHWSTFTRLCPLVCASSFIRKALKIFNTNIKKGIYLQMRPCSLCEEHRRCWLTAEKIFERVWELQADAGKLVYLRWVLFVLWEIFVAVW